MGAFDFLKGSYISHSLSSGWRRTTQLSSGTSNWHLTFPRQVNSYLTGKEKGVSYVISEETLAALVEGKLKCLRAEEGSGYDFILEYDAITYDVENKVVRLMWGDTVILNIDIPKLNEGDTFTISALQGRIPIKFHR